MRMADADAGGVIRAIPGGSVVWIDPILGDVGVAGATPSLLATSIRMLGVQTQTPGSPFKNFAST